MDCFQRAQIVNASERCGKDGKIRLWCLVETLCCDRERHPEAILAEAAVRGNKSSTLSSGCERTAVLGILEYCWLPTAWATVQLSNGLWIMDAPCTKHVCETAAEERIAWPFSSCSATKGCPWDEDTTLVASSCHESMEMLRWVRQQGCPWHPQIVGNAARMGRADVFWGSRSRQWSSLGLECISGCCLSWSCTAMGQGKWMSSGSQPLTF